MKEFPETRQSLLVRVRSQDSNAWTEFSEIYRPAIYRIVRRRGWQDADAQDIAQIVLLKIADAIGEFDTHGKARFRTWLTTVCRNTLVDELRRRNARLQPEDGASLEHFSSTDAISDEEMNLEHRRQVFRWAATRAANEFSTTTWMAFWKTSVDAMSAVDAAEHLSISVGAVYTARSRVMQTLKKWVQEYDDGDL